MGYRKRVLLVPSCGITPVDQLNKNDTLYRCERGLNLWRTGRFDRLLLSGGIFNPPGVQTIPASTLMCLWFLAHGVPEDRILCETTSLDTFENVAHGIDILKASDIWPCRITVATQWQHALRFFITFLTGFGVVVRLRFLRQPVSWMTWRQEWLFILYHLYDRRGNKDPARRNREARRQKK